MDVRQQYYYDADNHEMPLPPLSEASNNITASSMRLEGGENCNVTQLRRFRGAFGVISDGNWTMECNELSTFIDNWAPLFTEGNVFLKFLNNENVNAALAGVDEKSFWLWDWIGVKRIPALNIVN